MPKTGPQVAVARKTAAAALMKRVMGVGTIAAYVGVPASTSKDRSAQLLKMAGAAAGGRKRRYLKAAAENDINNAELLFVHTKGSPKRGIPARPVLQPAVEAEKNKKIISREVGAMVKAQLKGDRDSAMKAAGRAAIAGQNAARKWFTDPDNHWAPNRPATVRRKGSDRSLIDTGALRASIQGIVGEE